MAHQVSDPQYTLRPCIQSLANETSQSADLLVVFARSRWLVTEVLHNIRHLWLMGFGVTVYIDNILGSTSLSLRAAKRRELGRTSCWWIHFTASAASQCISTRPTLC